jgi:hypothetical protein
MCHQLLSFLPGSTFALTCMCHLFTFFFTWLYLYFHLHVSPVYFLFLPGFTFALIKVLSTFYSNLQPTRFIFFIFILWYLESLCLNISNKNNLFNYLSFLIGFKYIFNLNIFIIMFTIKLSVLILVITSSFQLHCVLNCFHLHLYVCLLNGV